MVAQLRKHAYGLWFFAGVSVLLALMTGWIGGSHNAQPSNPPTVYTFDPDEEQTGWQGDGTYHIVGVLNITADCDRRPLIAEAIPAPGADPVPMTWGDLDNRPRDESRGPSHDMLRLAVTPPEFFYRAYVKTVHICPAHDSAAAQALRDAGQPVRYVEVRTTLHEFAGNVVEQRSVTAREAQEQGR